MSTEPETRSDALRDTARYPLTLQEFEVAGQALEQVAGLIAREGEPGWEARCRMYHRIANRLRDYASRNHDVKNWEVS